MATARLTQKPKPRQSIIGRTTNKTSEGSTYQKMSRDSVAIFHRIASFAVEPEEGQQRGQRQRSDMAPSVLERLETSDIATTMTAVMATFSAYWSKGDRSIAERPQPDTTGFSVS